MCICCGTRYIGHAVWTVVLSTRVEDLQESSCSPRQRLQMRGRLGSCHGACLHPHWEYHRLLDAGSGPLPSAFNSSQGHARQVQDTVPTCVVDFVGLIIQPALGLLGVLIRDLTWRILVPVLRLGRLWVCDPGGRSGRLESHSTGHDTPEQAAACYSPFPPNTG